VSDFFTNLAARAVEGNATIRPRLATRFEPVAAPEPFTEVILETISPEAMTLTPMAPVAAKAPTAAPSPHEADPVAAVAVVPLPQATGAIPAATAAAAEPLPGRPALPKSPHPDEDALATAAAPIVAAPSAAALPRLATRHAEPPRDPSAAPHGDRAAVHPIVEKTHRAAAPASPAFPLLPEPSVPREIGTTPAPRVAAVERAEPPPAETIVHVSIGRIELRAPPMSPTPKRERAVPAVTTLAEYLQQRAAKTRK
jgi:hypothetical protein